jgi:hypothetical protein
VVIRLQVPHALPTARDEQVEGLAIREQIQVRALVVTEAIFQGFVQGVGEDEPRLASALPLVGRQGDPDLRPIPHVELTPAVDVVVEGDRPCARWPTCSLTVATRTSKTSS